MPTTILVTGASTGIGRATTERLVQTGALVFAGARAPADLAALGALGPGVVPVSLEVTDTASIAAARDVVAARTGGRLDALVNNAGIVVAGPLEIIDPADFRYQFEVNVVGPVLVTQAFLPLVRAARGRIVTVGSISGRFATPFAGAYAASKFAVEALCDALRIELAPFGIFVIVIEPGAIKTPLWARATAATTAAIDRVDPASFALYAGAIEKVRAFSAKLEAGGAPPDLVARAIERALTVNRPRARYLVGTDARVQSAIARLPTPVVDWMLRRLFAPRTR